MIARALAAHAAGSLDELAAYHAHLGRPVDCDPGLVPPEDADAECDLADALERRGVPVVPSRAVRQRRLAAVLRKMRRTP
jgi:hypothetical protein